MIHEFKGNFIGNVFIRRKNSPYYAANPITAPFSGFICKDNVREVAALYVRYPPEVLAYVLSVLLLLYATSPDNLVQLENMLLLLVTDETDQRDEA